MFANCFQLKYYRKVKYYYCLVAHCILHKESYGRVIAFCWGFWTAVKTNHHQKYCACIVMDFPLHVCWWLPPVTTGRTELQLVYPSFDNLFLVCIWSLGLVRGAPKQLKACPFTGGRGQRIQKSIDCKEQNQNQKNTQNPTLFPQEDRVKITVSKWGALKRTPSGISQVMPKDEILNLSTKQQQHKQQLCKLSYTTL